MSGSTTGAVELPIIDRERALTNLLELLEIEGLSGNERAVSDDVRRRLTAAGYDPARMRNDDAPTRVTRTELGIGNLIVTVPGRGERSSDPRRLLAGHLDTVPLCRGAEPVLDGDRIHARGDTALGGDNRTAVAAWVTVLETLAAQQLDHPPLTLLLTVAEEVGLLGAGAVNLEDLEAPAVGFNVDGGDPTAITIGAIGADRWEADVRGRSSHAGVHPEDGVSATLIASRAVTRVAERGYFGKVVQDGREGTSNVGVFRGGEATNQVTDHVFLRGECRSHDPEFLGEITQAYREELMAAADSVRNSSGRAGQVEFRVERDYDAFRLADDSPPIELARRAIEAVGLDATTRIANGGLDANCLNAKGIPTVTLGAGQHQPHTVDEYVDVGEYLTGCRVLLAVAMGR